MLLNSKKNKKNKNFEVVWVENLRLVVTYTSNKRIKTTLSQISWSFIPSVSMSRKGNSSSGTFGNPKPLPGQAGYKYGFFFFLN